MSAPSAAAGGGRGVSARGRGSGRASGRGPGRGNAPGAASSSANAPGGPSSSTPAKRKLLLSPTPKKKKASTPTPVVLTVDEERVQVEKLNKQMASSGDTDNSKVREAIDPTGWVPATIKYINDHRNIPARGKAPKGQTHWSRDESGAKVFHDEKGFFEGPTRTFRNMKLRQFKTYKRVYKSYTDQKPSNAIMAWRARFAENDPEHLGITKLAERLSELLKGQTVNDDDDEAEEDKPMTVKEVRAFADKAAARIMYLKGVLAEHSIEYNDNDVDDSAEAIVEGSQST